MHPMTLRAIGLVSLLAAPVLAQAQGMAGNWDGTLQLPGAELGLQLVLVLKAGAWSGTLSIPQQGARDLPLARLRVGADTVEFALAGVPGDPFFIGKLVPSGRLEGTLSQAGQTFPFALKRAAASADPPAQARPADPADRPVAFPGFNGFPLNASVRSGSGHGYFAVLVAGSGPTDRDWSNPLIPGPSHGGRDVAAWLQQQGLGSLRYDKRFIGARDPQLDISLDAQSGDLAAALKAARALPEARGRKLLLVGHSEGALLALLNAHGADAVLLLAMPGQTLASQVLDQVRYQFATAGAGPEVAGPSLDHLAAVLEAARARKDPPKPGPGVLPSVAGLGTQLTRPGTLDYFRSIMDLDPWRLASRVAVPLAAAWGDRDVQCWKPLIPDGFKGVVLDLPGANHLLKQETRPVKDLNPALALSAYGDDTPLADLGPIGRWLKGLK